MRRLFVAPVLIALASAAYAAQPLAPQEPAAAAAAPRQGSLIRWARGEARAPVAYEGATGHVLFRISIAGRETWALLDNGAQGSLIDLALARQLGLKLGPEASIVRTSGGSMPSRGVRNVPLAIAGQFEARAPLLAGTDLRPLSSLLGRDVGFVLGGDFLHRVTLQFDPGRRTFNLYPSGALRAPPTAPFLPLRNDPPQVEVRIGDRTLLLTIDLGDSAVMSVTPETWARIAPPGAELRPSSHRQADGSRQAGHVGRLPELKVGPASVADVPVSVRRLGDRMGEGTLGIGFFSRVGFVLDARQGKIWLRPIGAAPAR